MGGIGHSGGGETLGAQPAGVAVATGAAIGVGLVTGDGLREIHAQAQAFANVVLGFGVAGIVIAFFASAMDVGTYLLLLGLVIALIAALFGFTGIAAGERDHEGRYTEGSVNDRVQKKLQQYVEQQKRLAPGNSGAVPSKEEN